MFFGCIAIWSAVATTKTPQRPLRSEKRKTKILCPFKSLRLFRPCRDAMRPGRIKSLRRHPKSIKRGWEGEYKVENTGTPGDKQERQETNKLMGKRIALVSVNPWARSLTPHSVDLTQSITQVIDQSVNPSINQSSNRSINRSLTRSINQSLNRPINESINHSIHDVASR